MKRLLVHLSLLVLPFASTTVLAELPQVSDAHIVQPPPGAPVAGGYLTIANTSDDDLILTGASSEDVARIEVHLSRIVDDVATMEHQERLVVPAGSTLEFTHGSYHLMLMGLVSPLAPGDEIKIILESSAGPIPVLLPVVAPGSGAVEGHGEHAMDHGEKATPEHGEDHATKEGHSHGDTQ